jgi:hypothetical protein
MAANDSAGSVPEDHEAPVGEPSQEDKLLEEISVYETRWGKQKRVAEERRRRLLWKVPVNENDVATIASECELDLRAAELKLREHGGDVESVLRAYILREVEALKKLHPDDVENVQLGLMRKDVISPTKSCFESS